MKNFVIYPVLAILYKVSSENERARLKTGLLTAVCNQQKKYE